MEQDTQAAPAPPSPDLTSEAGTTQAPADAQPRFAHLLKPFESFAPNLTPASGKQHKRELPTEFDPCDRNALGESARQHPVLYGPPQIHGQDYFPGTDQGEVRSELFEGIGGAGLSPDCFQYGEDNAHGYTFAYFSELTERTSERLLTRNHLPGVMEFEAEARMEGDHLRFELRAHPEKSRAGHSYWLDHCVGLDAAIFNERARHYYFDPEPVEIAFPPVAGKPTDSRDIERDPQVTSWWEDIDVQGKAEPYLLVHQPGRSLNVLLYWQDAALLKVRKGHCIHVNPAILANGKPQTRTGELHLFQAPLSEALAFARARMGR